MSNPALQCFERKIVSQVGMAEEKTQILQKQAKKSFLKHDEWLDSLRHGNEQLSNYKTLEHLVLPNDKKNESNIFYFFLSKTKRMFLFINNPFHVLMEMIT